MNPFGSMMGFGMGPNLFSGGMPFYNPFPRMPMFGGGLGGFGGFGGFGGYGGGMGGGFNPFGSQFGGMGGGFNPFMMSPPPMQRFPRYDSLIPMQSQMPRQIIENKEISNRFKELKDQLNNRIRIDDSPIAQLRLRDRLGEQRPPSIEYIPKIVDDPRPPSIEQEIPPFDGIFRGEPVDPEKWAEDVGVPLTPEQKEMMGGGQGFMIGDSNGKLIPVDAPPPIKSIQDPNIRQALPGGSTWVPPGATTVPESPIPIEEFNRNFRNIMQTDPMSIQSKEDLDNLMTGPLFARQRDEIFQKYIQNPINQLWEASQSRKTQEDPRIKPPTPSVREFIEQERPTPSFTPFDPSGLQSRIGDLEGRQMFDPSGLKSRIDALENRQMPAFTSTPFDPSGLQSQIDALQNRQMPMFDPSGLQSRLNALEGRVQKTGNLNMTDIEALIEQRLSDSLRNMDLSSRNPGVNSITYDPTLISEIQKDLPPPIKEYNDRLFIGQFGPGDI